MLQLLPDAVSLTRFIGKGKWQIVRNIPKHLSEPKPGQRAKLETEIEKDFPQTGIPDAWLQHQVTNKSGTGSTSSIMNLHKVHQNTRKSIGGTMSGIKSASEMLVELCKFRVDQSAFKTAVTRDELMGVDTAQANPLPASASGVSCQGWRNWRRHTET